MKNLFLKKFPIIMFKFLFCSFGYYSVYASTTFEVPTLEMLGSEEWVKAKVKIYPELEWLLDPNVQHTQEGTVEQFPHSWSQKLQNAHYPEFERTILSLVCLYLINDGSEEAYKRFTILQSPSEKLTYESFKRLHSFAQKIIQNDLNQLQLLEINLILGDMGKTQMAHEKSQKYKISEADHDIFLDKCLEKCPQIFPTFQLLTPSQQEQLKKRKALFI